MTKAVGRDAENAKISLRNIRRDAFSAIKTQVKEGEMSEDEGRRMEQKIQKLTDAAAAEVETMADGKKQELMTV